MRSVTDAVGILKEMHFNYPMQFDSLTGLPVDSISTSTEEEVDELTTFIIQCMTGYDYPLMKCMTDIEKLECMTFIRMDIHLLLTTHRIRYELIILNGAVIVRLNDLDSHVAYSMTILPKVTAQVINWFNDRVGMNTEIVH